MIQRRRLHREIDDELQKFVSGTSKFKNEIELALEKCDPLTRELVFFRARGGDYRQALIKFNISASTYYNRLKAFRQSLLLIIKE